MVELLANGGKEMKPMMLKAGLALALSFAGYVFSRIKSRQATDTNRHRRFPSSSGCGRHSCFGLKDDLHFMKHEGSIVSVTPDADAELSQVNASVESEDGYLLPEFNDLVQEEFKIAEKEQPVLETSDALTPSVIVDNNNSDVEQEMTNLKNLVQSLQEREKKLEFQLLEYYGLKEQDAAVKELDSRLKCSNMEAKLFSLKIDSLQAENQRLEAQLSDYSGVVAELESTKQNIKILKTKLISDTDQLEKMSVLQKRIAAIEGNEHAESKHDESFEQTMKRLRNLEIEVMDLRTENSNLAQAKLELVKELESGKPNGLSSIDALEIYNALEVSNRLRRTNEELSKELEQLQADRAIDVEELVHLRWVNACLKFELRNYQLTESKIGAKDTSKKSSSKPEEKAKELILEYANSGYRDKILMDFDSEYCSSSQESSLTENGEFDDSSTTTSTKNSNKSSKNKFLGKLKKLVLGKESQRKRFPPSLDHVSYDNPRRRASTSNCSFDDAVGRYSIDSSISSSLSMDHAPANSSTRIDEIVSQDLKSKRFSIERARLSKPIRCTSDLGSTITNKKHTLEEHLQDSPLSEQLSHELSDSTTDKVQPKKFASILKNNESPRINNRII